MEPIPNFDAYAELEVSPTASPETIEAAWRSLMKRNHPDTGGPGAAARARRLNVAHDWLADPAKRAEYDRSRRAAPVREPIQQRQHADAAPRRPDPKHEVSYGPQDAAVRALLDRARRLTRDEIRALDAAHDDGKVWHRQDVRSHLEGLAQNERTMRQASAYWTRAQDAAVQAVPARGLGWHVEGGATNAAKDAALALAAWDALAPHDFNFLYAPWARVAGEPRLPQNKARVPRAERRFTGPGCLTVTVGMLAVVLLLAIPAA